MVCFQEFFRLFPQKKRFYFLWPLQGFVPYFPWASLAKNLTGFSGSSGFLLLREDAQGPWGVKGCLVTDGRYKLQAQEELRNFFKSSLDKHGPFSLREGSWTIKDILSSIEYLESLGPQNLEQPKIIMSQKAPSVFMAQGLEKQYECQWLSAHEENMLLTYNESLSPWFQISKKDSSKVPLFLHRTFSFQELCTMIWPHGPLGPSTSLFSRESQETPKKPSGAMIILEKSWDISWLLGLRCHRKNSHWYVSQHDNQDSSMKNHQNSSKPHEFFFQRELWAMDFNQKDSLGYKNEKKQGIQYQNNCDAPVVEKNAPFNEKHSKKLPEFQGENPSKQTWPFHHKDLEIPLQEDPLCALVACLLYHQDTWQCLLYCPTKDFSQRDMEEVLKTAHYHCLGPQDVKFFDTPQDFFQSLEEIQKNHNYPLVFDPQNFSMDLYKNLQKTPNTSIPKEGLLRTLQERRSKKTPQEIQGMCWANKMDSLCITRFLYWLLHRADLSQETEFSLAQRLESYRRYSGKYGYYGQSFSTISASGSNSAFIHYKTSKNTTNVPLNSGPYLLDAGGHYCSFSRSLYGTSDISRSLWLSVGPQEASKNIPQKYKEWYTRVLRGHINGVLGYFPQNTPGAVLDGLARKPLWTKGKTYTHATSHGVGCYGPVHEFPPTLSPRSLGDLQENMILSHEPGYYEDQWGGIRLENLFCVKSIDSIPEDFSCIFSLGPKEKNPSSGVHFEKNFKDLIRDPLEFKKSENSSLWLYLEPITYVPFFLDAVIFRDLSPEEIQWLHWYYLTLLDILGDSLNPEEYQWISQDLQKLSTLM